MADLDLAVRCDMVTVEYGIDQYRYSTFKEFVVQHLRGQRGRRAFRALDSVSVSIRKGESVALIGHNGSGKSTLLKVIAGVVVPTGGTVATTGVVAPMIELGTGFDAELSGRENIYIACALMGLSRAEIDARLDSVIDFAEIRDFIDMPFKNYSSGMQARLGFACTTTVSPDILLIDEVLAVGDHNFAKKCMARIGALRERGCTLIFVSHDYAAIRQYCRRGIVLEKGVVKFDGEVDQALQIQDQIMDQRYLAALPPAERGELLRTRALAEDYRRFDPTTRPRVTATYFVEQGGRMVEQVTADRGFDIRCELTAGDLAKFSGDVSIGIGIQKHGTGERVGGANTLESKLAIELDRLARSDGRIQTTFRFPAGIPALGSGVYDLVIGVHDERLSRTVFVEVVGHFRVCNPLDQVNSAQDILVMSPSLGAIDITYQ